MIDLSRLSTWRCAERGVGGGFPLTEEFRISRLGHYGHSLNSYKEAHRSEAEEKQNEVYSFSRTAYSSFSGTFALA